MTTTSPQSSGRGQPEPRYLAIGRIVRAHGLQGEVSAIVLTDFPERFAHTEQVYLGNEFEAEAYRLQKYRWHQQHILLTLEGITTRTQAEQLRGLLVQIPITEATPLPPGDYYLYQVMGLEVITLTGQILGTVTGVIETKANDVYIITTPANQEILIPAIPLVIKTIDLAKKQLIVELLEGLI